MVSLSPYAFMVNPFSYAENTMKCNLLRSGFGGNTEPSDRIHEDAQDRPGPATPRNAAVYPIHIATGTTAKISGQIIDK